jgi:hypothetical protein
MWRGEDVKMRRCEDEKMWWCEDVKLWRWEDVRLRRCEDEKMWRCEDVRIEDVMWRCEDVKMWRCENGWQTPTIRRTPNAQTLSGKIMFQTTKQHSHDIPMAGWFYGFLVVAKASWHGHDQRRSTHAVFDPKKRQMSKPKPPKTNLISLIDHWSMNVFCLLVAFSESLSKKASFTPVP